MARCDTCGNDYDGAFEITQNGQTYTFDSSSAPSTGWHRSAPPANAR